MSSLRKLDDSAGQVSETFPPAPEALQYEDDVTPETVKALQKRANKKLRKEKWVVIDGYVGSK